MDPVELLVEKIGDAEISIEHTRSEIRGIDKSHGVPCRTVEYDRVADAGYIVSCRPKKDPVREHARRGEQDRDAYKEESDIGERFDDPIRSDPSCPHDKEKEIDAVCVAGRQIAHDQKEHHSSVEYEPL